jgi:hypothetical protein
MRRSTFNQPFRAVNTKNKIAICAVIGFAFHRWLAHYCLLHHSPPFGPFLTRSAQTYWDRYADKSPNHGPAKFVQISAAIGCDFLIIDASPANVGSGAPPRMMITRAGFPFASFEGMQSWGPVTPAHAWSIPIQPRLLNVAWVSVVPYRPLLLGVLANTAFWGFAAWCLLFAPAVMYRTWKKHRRQSDTCCWNCSYDLRGKLAEGCPECGWRRE